MRFDDRPDFDYLKRIFRDLFFQKGYTYDNVFDWEICSSGGAVVNVVPSAEGGAGDSKAKVGGSGDSAEGPAPPSELSGVADGGDDMDADEEYPDEGGAGGSSKPSPPTTATSGAKRGASKR